MSIISSKLTRKFSLLSGDANKIHFDKEFCKSFFFKSPIVHGVNLTVLALNFFLTRKKNFFFIKELTINFKNYCFNDEKFLITNNKNKITVKNNLNIKVDIEINSSRKIKSKATESKFSDYTKKIINFYKFKNLNSILNIKLIEHLIFASYYIGSIKPGNSSLIHSIKIKFINNKKISKTIISKKILNNIYQIKLTYNGFESVIIASKIKKFKFFSDLILPQKIFKKIKNKKILFFGSSSDLAIPLISYLKKKNIKYKKFSLNKIKNINKKIMHQFLNKFNPDYIFYLSSPQIIPDHIKNNFLFKSYKKIYYKYFLFLLNCLNKNKFKPLIFYPSSSFLDNEKNSNFKSYIQAKQLGEKLCKNHPYTKFIRIYRLPKFKTRSNYNFLGFYEGKNLTYLKKYLINFFN